MEPIGSRNDIDSMAKFKDEASNDNFSTLLFISSNVGDGCSKHVDFSVFFIVLCMRRPCSNLC